MPTVEELGKRVKAKHPGAYDDLSDGDVGRKVKAKFPGAYDDFTDTSSNLPSNEVKKPEASVVGDFLSGAASGLASTVVHGGDLIRRGLGMERIIERPEVQELMRAPESTAGTIGRFAEGAAEFAVPLARLTRATAGMGLAKRMGAEALGGAGVAGIQTGGDPTSMLAGGALAAAVPAVVPAISLAKWVAGQRLAQASANSVPVIGPLLKAGMQRVAGKPARVRTPRAPSVAPTPGMSSADYYAQQTLPGVPATPVPPVAAAPVPPAAVPVAPAVTPPVKPTAVPPKLFQNTPPPVPAQTTPVSEVIRKGGQLTDDFNFGYPAKDNPLASRTFAPATKGVPPANMPPGASEEAKRAAAELAEELLKSGTDIKPALAPKSSATTKITQARLEKSGKIAEKMNELGLNSVQLEPLPYDSPFWKVAAKRAGVNPPNSEETRNLILAQMKRLEKPK